MLAPIVPLHPSAGDRTHICAPANRSLAPKPDCRHDCFPPGRFRRPRRSSVGGPMGDGCGRRPLRARGAGGRTPGGGGRSWVGRCAARWGRNRGDGAPARASPAPGAPTGGGPHRRGARRPGRGSGGARHGHRPDRDARRDAYGQVPVPRRDQPRVSAPADPHPRSRRHPPGGPPRGPRRRGADATPPRGAERDAPPMAREPAAGPGGTGDRPHVPHAHRRPPAVGRGPGRSVLRGPCRASQRAPPLRVDARRSRRPV